MTIKPKPKKPALSPTTRVQGDRKIVRDETFMRATADEIMPLALGRDIELSCLQFSPLLNGLVDEGDHYVPNTEDVLAEVARIRISYREAVELAMSILAQGITSGRVNGKAVAESIEQWVTEYEAKSGVSDDG